VTVILAWALKRSAVARLQGIASGFLPCPAGAEALLGDDVQVSYMLPAEPDRVCVHGTPVRSSRLRATEERSVTTETVTLELRIRVYQPGGDTDDPDDSSMMMDVALTTSRIANAVAVALLDGDPLTPRNLGSLDLTEAFEWPTAVMGHPEPAALGLSSLIFQAGLVTS
jgi:hypothetical protein